MKTKIAKKILIAVLFGILTALGVVSFIIINHKIHRLPATATFLNYSLKNMNYEEVDDVVKNKIQKKLQKEKIKVKVFDKIFSVSPKELNAHFKTSDIFNYAKAKEENEIPKIKYDKNKLESLLKDLKEKSKVKPKKYKYKKLQDKVIVSAGKYGTEIYVDDAMNKIDNSLNTLNFKPVVPKVTRFLSDQSKIDLQEIKKKVDINVKDAAFSMQGNKRVYEPEIVGVELNLKDAQKIVKNSYEGRYEIPLKITKPKVTIESLKEKHKRPPNQNQETLSSFTTHFSNAKTSETQARNHNIRLAAQGINGVVLLPGEEFSFKETAGRQNGYLPAKTYQNSKTVLGIGGGMCQVSTTLFNAAIKANMDITCRRCHSLPVYYVPWGRDATYNNGSPDFKFVNSLKNPVKICASVSSSSITVSFLGTKIPEENFDVALESHITNKTSNNISAVFNVTVKLNGTVVKTKSFNSSYKKEN